MSPRESMWLIMNCVFSNSAVTVEAQSVILRSGSRSPSRALEQHHTAEQLLLDKSDEEVAVTAFVRGESYSYIAVRLEPGFDCLITHPEARCSLLNTPKRSLCSETALFVCNRAPPAQSN